MLHSSYFFFDQFFVLAVCVSARVCVCVFVRVCVWLRSSLRDACDHMTKFVNFSINFVFFVSVEWLDLLAFSFRDNRLLELNECF